MYINIAAKLSFNERGLKQSIEYLDSFNWTIMMSVERFADFPMEKCVSMKNQTMVDMSQNVTLVLFVFFCSHEAMS